MLISDSISRPSPRLESAQRGVAEEAFIDNAWDCGRSMPKGGWQEFSSDASLQRPAAAASEPVPKAQQVVRVQPTRGGKGGKTVTLIRGLELDGAGFKALLKKLKTRIGSGGTAKDGVIELQGDQVDLALELLANEGYRPKRAGG